MEKWELLISSIWFIPVIQSCVFISERNPQSQVTRQILQAGTLICNLFFFFGWWKMLFIQYVMLWATTSQRGQVLCWSLTRRLRLTRWQQPWRSLPARPRPRHSSPRGRGSYRSCGRSRGPSWQQRQWTAPSGPVAVRHKEGLGELNIIRWLRGTAVWKHTIWDHSMFGAKLQGRIYPLSRPQGRTELWDPIDSFSVHCVCII